MAHEPLRFARPSDPRSAHRGAHRGAHRRALPAVAVGLAAITSTMLHFEAKTADLAVLDRNGDGTLERFEAAAAAIALVDAAGADGDGSVALEKALAATLARPPQPADGADGRPRPAATFRVVGAVCTVDGTLGTEAPAALMEAIVTQPGLREIRFGALTGEENAHEVARLIELSGLSTRMTRATSMVGTSPLATAAKRRYVEPGAIVWQSVEREARMTGSALDALRTEPTNMDLLSIGRPSSLRGLCALSSDIAWVTGSGATVAVTNDGGKNWRQVAPESIESLDVRDVHALDAQTAWILTAGPGETSRILFTADGGATWTEQHRETDRASFLDGFSFWDDKRAIAYGDPLPEVGFRVLTTSDSGASWQTQPVGPSPLESGEASFAASGTGIRTDDTSRAWIVTGATDANARVFRTDDNGATWQAFETPIAAKKPASGAFSLSMRDDGKGVIVGGDFMARDKGGVRCAAWTDDFGATWQPPTVGPRGQRAGSAVVGNGHFVATGQTGTDISTDGGKTWRALSDEGYHCVDVAARDGTIWFAGPNGRAARLR